VGGHLAAAGVGVVGLGQGREQLVARGHPEHQREGQVPVVGSYPVVTGTDVHAQRHLDGLLAHPETQKRASPGG